MKFHTKFHTKFHKYMSLSKQRIRKLTRTGTVSYTVNMPKDFIKNLGWKERQRLTVTLRGKSIVIKDYPTKK